MPHFQPAEGSTREPLAIVGFSLKFPQDAVSEQTFWEMLLQGRMTRTDIPQSRMNVDAFYSGEGSGNDTLRVRGGSFLREDIAAFDAGFFSMSSAEAKATDPLQRGLLETTYRAMETAGMKLDAVAGSNTSVFVGCLSDDYKMLNSKDPERLAQYGTTGLLDTMLANKISWFFNFTGNSITLDTACSSGLIALDLGCQGLLNGETDMSVIAGCNLMFAPDLWLMLNGINGLSPDGISHSFDSRGNGYARGEGFAVVIVKRLSDAIRDNDTIRAVIRSTGSNQNGRTQSGITQTSQAAQESLMRTTYEKADLDMALTQYVEAHATGTKFGDAVELKSIGRTFRSTRSPDKQLYVGCVKPNIGHLEGASGLAGIIKTILVLENGIIPPVANFEKINIRANESSLRIKIPRQATLWPTEGLRRASVNSVGVGGSNAHVILDDAYHFLEAHGMAGNTNTKIRVLQNTADVTAPSNSPTNGIQNGYPPKNSPMVLVWSAADESGLVRLAKAYTEHFKQVTACPQSLMPNLAYTLNHRRSLLRHRSFAVVASMADLARIESHMGSPVVARTSTPRLGLVFTGQGASWPQMARELRVYPEFSRSLEEAEWYFETLNCPWKLRDEIFREPNESRVYRSEYSQPLCTAIQVALVDLLKSFEIPPAVVVGHSSGEIAAAYCAGAISAESAWKIAYYRGLTSANLSLPGCRRGAMVAVLLSETDILPYLEEIEKRHGTLGLTIACYNSERNLTISGDEDQVDTLQSILTEVGHRWYRLKIDVAYHSPHMNTVADEFLARIEDLKGPAEKQNNPASPVLMVSSVTGTLITADELLDRKYWVRNLVSPVRFHQAVSLLCKPSTSSNRVPNLDLSHRRDCAVDVLLEVGPHSALQGAIRDVLRTCGNNASEYMSMLTRGQNSLSTTLIATGMLFCAGYPVDLARVNRLNGEKLALLSGLPQYPFEHSQKYWYESRVSAGMRFAARGKHELLGKPVPDWNPLDARWRHFLSTPDVVWLEDHKIQNRILLPAAGMLSTAIEAAKRLASEDRRVVAFKFTHVQFLAALVVPSAEYVETQISLRPEPQKDIYTRDESRFEFKLSSYMDDRWTENCRGKIAVEYEKDRFSGLGSGQEVVAKLTHYQTLVQDTTKSCAQPAGRQQLYRCLRNHGFAYGPTFQVLEDIKIGDDKAVANISVHDDGNKASISRTYAVHPTTLDGIMQVVLASVTKGGSETIPTMVPTQIDRLWVSNSGLACSSTENPQPAYSHTITAAAEVVSPAFPWCKSAVTVLDQHGRKLLARIDGLRFTAISSGGIGERPDSRAGLCRRIDWQPDISLLRNDEIETLCKRGNAPEVDQTELCHNLDCLIYLSWARMIWQPAEGDFHSATSSTIRKYISWARSQLDLHGSERLSSPPINKQKLLDDPNSLENYRRAVESTSSRGKLYALVSKNLPALLNGKLDPLSLLFQDDLVSQFYQEMNNANTCHALREYLNLLVHLNPTINVLEIGAGTGATTRIVVNTLRSSEHTTRYSRFDFTDVSPSFFEKAQAEFGQMPGMNFKVLDIEQSPEDQGFQLGSHDLLIAANVLHATKSLDATLRRVRCLLKDGGKLILTELVQPQLARAGFVFGLLPGWWLGSEDGREWGPLLSESQWNDRLISTGFSGTDLVFRDSENSACHEMSVIISTAVLPSPPDTCGYKSPSVVIVTPDDRLPEEICDIELKFQLQQCGLRIHDVLRLQEVAMNELPSSTIFLLMLELDRPFLSNISAQSFTAIQRILKDANGVVWLTRSDHDASPEFQMIEGLARTVRRENNRSIFVTVAFDMQSPADLSADQIDRLCQIIQKTDFEQGDHTCDGDYIEYGGKMHIGRVNVDGELNEAVSMGTVVRQPGSEDIGASLPLEIKMNTPAALDSFHFTDDNLYSASLKDDELEIRVEASGLIFHDCLIATGKIPLTEFGFECSGVASRTGAKSGFTPGQRVYGMAPGTFKTFARLNCHLADEIPATLSFTEAASLPTSFVTAHYALSITARMCPGDSILIHSAAGGTGQAAIQVAKFLGASEIFATVSTEEKKKLLIDTYGIPADHIFCSRETSFADAITTMTKDGVDIVLNSLSGQGLLASWECIAPHGRFVELGKRDILENNSLPMQPFLRNTSYMAIDLETIVRERPRLLANSLKEISRLLKSQHFHPIQPLQTFGFSNIGEAMHHMLSGRSSGKIVLEKESKPSLPVILRSDKVDLFHENKTYVIAGGLGGVGRSIARWMLDHGARYLLLLSRSGSSGPAAGRFIEELQARGAVVKTPVCDISDAASLKSVLQSIKPVLPPIGGCIQAAMVLRDSLFENMSYEDWKMATDPKVHGSWNLHELLPKSLDFFILLSSLGGIVGFSGQSNYAAGNTYQDALARYRRARGLPAVSVDLGGMFSDGYIAENEEVAERIFASGYYSPLYRKDLFALLGNLCRPRSSSTTDQINDQVLFGLTRPAHLSPDELTTYSNGALAPPLFSTMRNYNYGSAIFTSSSSSSSSFPTVTLDYHSKFIQAETEIEAGEIAAQATIHKLQSMLPHMDRVEIWKPMLAYGVDSLVAVELRNWYAKEFRAQVTAFDIMGGETFMGLGIRIALVSELRGNGKELSRDETAVRR